MKKQIPSLNGLRALSIFLVLLYHFDQKCNHNFLYKKIPVLIDGQFGVNIFFVISGFLITTLLLKEEEKTGTISLKGFYLKRVIRIFPVYYTLLTVYLILQLTGVLQFTATSWLTSLTYTKYLNHTSDWESAHLWSLSIEEQFYALWPLAFLAGARFRKQFAFALILLVPILRMSFVRTQIQWMDALTIFQRADAIMWGCLFAIYHKPIWNYCSGIIQKYKLAALLPFLMIFALDSFTRLNVLYSWHMGIFIASIGGITGTLSDISIGLILLISIHLTDNIWYKLLNTRFTDYVGKLSYSIYIWQQLFFSKKIGILSSFPLNLVLIFIVANCSYYFIEQPALKLKSRLKLQ